MQVLKFFNTNNRNVFHSVTLKVSLLYINIKKVNTIYIPVIYINLYVYTYIYGYNIHMFSI